MCIAITNRVLRLLYGPTEGTDTLLLIWNEFLCASPFSCRHSSHLLIPLISNAGAPPVAVNISSSQVYFAWHFFNNILGNPNDLLSPAVFLEAVSSIRNLVEMYLAVGMREVAVSKGVKPPKLPYPPSANTILDTYGQVLFNATYKDVNAGFVNPALLVCRSPPLSLVSMMVALKHSVLCVASSVASLALLSDRHISRSSIKCCKWFCLVFFVCSPVSRFLHRD